MSKPDQQPPWTDCVAHPMAFDTDCDYCNAELQGKQTYLDQLREANADINRKLHQMTGTPFIETSPAVAMVAVTTLVEMILSDPRARMAYEVNFSGKLHQMLSTVEQQAIRQQLMGGMNGAPRNLKNIRGG